MKYIEKIRTFLFRNQKNKKPIFTCVFVVFLLLFALLHSKIDYIVNLYFGIPIILCTYYFGFLYGLLFWAIELIFHVAYLFLLKENYSFIYLNSRVRIAFISLFVVMYIVNFFRSVKNNLEESENRYRLVSEELQKLNQTKDKFFSIIAHDLRGPLGSINVNLEYLIHEKSNLSEEYKDEIHQGLYGLSTRVFNLLENLLKWALIQKNEIEIRIEKINLKYQSQENIELFTKVAQQKEISLKNEIKNDYYVLADKNAIDTVMRNFISNAIKFTNFGGKISLFAEESDENISFVVEDNGLGMDEIILNKLFKINENVVLPGTKGEKGTGLGLILCNELVNKCKGTISVKSKLKQGSTFKASFPKIL